MARLDILYLSTADHGQERRAPQVRISSLKSTTILLTQFHGMHIVLPNGLQARRISWGQGIKDGNAGRERDVFACQALAAATEVRSSYCGDHGLRFGGCLYASAKARKSAC
jgi:hypothetical protein